MSSFCCSCKLCTLTQLCTCYLLCLCVSILVARKDFTDTLDSTNREFDLLQDIVRGHRLRPDFRKNGSKKFYNLEQDNRRKLKVSNHLLQQIIPEIVSGKDYTFLVTARQKPNNRGSLIAFTHQNRKRFLELQSIHTRHEYRFHHLFTLAATHVNTERMRYMPNDRQWHRIALTVSGSLLELRVDCRRVFSRRVPYPPPQTEFVNQHRQIQLWVGQRGPGRSVFVGSISEAKIVTGPNGYESQCHQLESRVPISGVQLQSLQSLFSTLQHEVGVLRHRLNKAETQLENFAKCDCIRSCRLGDLKVRDGETVKNGSCSNCTCLSGQLTCSKPACPPTPCKYPVWPENSCCPTCLSRCEFRGVVYDHGEELQKKAPNKKICVICTCHDGTVRCKQYRNFSHICPKLHCSVKEQFTAEGHCCKLCPGMDFCSSKHRCHKDAECHSLSTSYTCRCKSGYKGNGYHCEDINECEESPGGKISLCGYNSHCLNLNGSYQCKCYDGFEMGSLRLCRDIDECRMTNACPKDAQCTNTIGSYKCRCRDGYALSMKSMKCIPICPPCQNSGVCIKPNICRCPFGFYGKLCEKDVDECALGIHGCPENSRCRNLPGSYFCQCQKGFKPSGPNLELCDDINECAGARGISFTCGPQTKCVNLLGGYKCICKQKNCSCQKDGCYSDCIVSPSTHRHSSVSHGSLIGDINDPCKVCSCRNGVLTCERRQCNCSKAEDVLCCPQCFQGNCHDKSLNKTFNSGEKWIANCKECLCRNGTTVCHPILCPSMRGCSGSSITPVGHCCPICTETMRSICHYDYLHSEKFSGSSKGCSLRSQTVQAAIKSEQCLQCHCKGNATCCTQREGCKIHERIP